MSDRSGGEETELGMVIEKGREEKSSGTRKIQRLTILVSLLNPIIIGVAGL